MLIVLCFYELVLYREKVVREIKSQDNYSFNKSISTTVSILPKVCPWNDFPIKHWEKKGEKILYLAAYIFTWNFLSLSLYTHMQTCRFNKFLSCVYFVNAYSPVTPCGMTATAPFSRSGCKQPLLKCNLQLYPRVCKSYLTREHLLRNHLLMLNRYTRNGITIHLLIWKPGFIASWRKRALNHFSLCR